MAEESSRREPALRGLVDEAELLAEAVFDTVQESLLVLDSDLRVLLANRSFYLTFKVEPVDTLDRLVYELGAGQWDVPALRHLLQDILPHNGHLHDYEIKHDFPGIGRKVMRLNAHQLRRRSDQKELLLLAIEDVTEEYSLREEQQTTIEALQRTEQSLCATIEEKTMLLQEVHHRVRNNLQVIGSLLSLQAEELHEDGERRAFQVAQNRVQSIAEVHDLLYVSQSAGAIDLRAYTQRLGENLAMAYGVSDRIEAHVEGGQITLDVRRAVVVGLLLNEVISNAYKHAFPGNRTGRVTIGITVNKDEATLSVTDTGVGADSDDVNGPFRRDVNKVGA
ncbi:MAG TPA: histidine kinase dimerization/phosphoacceptor domain -containing protein [Pyrinomonadaceae bacterium]|nr:histidine kinase dimerization/phosphoacceptor domain -containing protein [Pyrinomonadaceae bacterium]